MTNSNVRSRRQSARHQVAQQAGGDGSRFGGAFAQAQHVFPALCVDPQRDHHAVVPEDLAVDADHPQVQLAQRPAKKRLEALCRQRHEPPRHGAARRRPLGHVGRNRVQRARVPARRYPGGDRGQRVLVQRVGGRRPLEARQRDLAIRAPHAEPRQLDLPPAERHLAVDTPSAPRGPLDLMAPLRTTQDFPVRLHHRLQDLQPGRDAQAMERFADTVDHAEHRQRHLDRDGSRVGGLAGRLPPVMLRHGWQSPFRLHPLSYHRTGAGAATRFTSAQVQQRPGHPRYPIATGVIEGACRYLVRDRMELTGARWRLVGAEAVLKLRALRASGDFDAYWDFHEAREYERNHAQRYADGTAPPVSEPPPPPSPPRLRRVK